MRNTEMHHERYRKLESELLRSIIQNHIDLINSRDGREPGVADRALDMIHAAQDVLHERGER